MVEEEIYKNSYRSLFYAKKGGSIIDDILISMTTMEIRYKRRKWRYNDLFI